MTTFARAFTALVLWIDTAVFWESERWLVANTLMIALIVFILELHARGR